uniref:Osteoclast-stimulating factor 1 n=1 Tax=Ditylenchus dipsaci TaxID=166011 RepID=A0A915DPH9_9BILA
MPPPPPVAKPGRVQVYHVLAGYSPQKEYELLVEEGDLLYISETSASSGQQSQVESKCGDNLGKLPSSYVNNENYVLRIEFPLHEAAKRGNFELLEECLKNNVSVNSLDKSGSTALYWAAHGGHSKMVHFLLNVPKICISSQNKIGDTPLHAASWKNRLECVEMLVEAGADVHSKNKELKKPVDLAASPEIAAFLRLAIRKVVEPEDNYEGSADSSGGDDN